jgi:hypothetical protein
MRFDLILKNKPEKEPHQRKQVHEKKKLLI